ncbi:SH3 domain-binding glutamic acid-rich protein homolog [Schistocerca nitens]|uniref:SH3 domain-binding glutamic acid-rich protein homolog n=1 Tax=Schistocerca nitens TaxID=7011 RepID=UPI0021176131|nr:SH3 domain-binding glutamic acid-rich protein homolog [Schistocerca nitens]
MVVKVYISGISGNKEVKKRQQRVQMILDSKSIEYVTVDITEPGNENEKEFMQQNGKARSSKYPLPPQLFNEEDYCGDYEDFDMANEIDELEKFLKMTPAVSKAEINLEKSETSADENVVENGELNGNTTSRENSSEKNEDKEAAGSAADERREEKTEEAGDQQNEEE